MRMFITSKNKYLSNYMNIFWTCSIPLNLYKKMNVPFAGVIIIVIFIRRKSLILLQKVSRKSLILLQKCG